MKKMYLILAAAMTAMTVLSCQKNGSDMTIVPTGDGVIRFTVDAPDVDLQTKATVVTTSTIEANGFNCSAVTGSAGSFASAWNNVSFSKGSTYYEGGKFWPSSDPSYKFFASNATLTHSAYGCTVAATNATDVVCAYLASPTYETPNALSFNHIFARIGNFTVTAVDGYTITNVHASITPNTGGTYNIATGNGQTNGVGWSSLTSGSATELANTTPGTKANDLYLVPGTYAINFSWRAAKGDFVSDFNHTVTGINIVGGKVNSITAGLTGDAESIQFSISVTEWGSNTASLGTLEPETPPATITSITSNIEGSSTVNEVTRISSYSFYDNGVMINDPYPYYYTTTNWNRNSAQNETNIIHIYGTNLTACTIEHAGTDRITAGYSATILLDSYNTHEIISQSDSEIVIRINETAPSLWGYGSQALAYTTLVISGLDIGTDYIMSKHTGTGAL